MTPSLEEQIQEAADEPVTSLQPLHGGMVSDVRLVVLGSGDRLVAKSSQDVPLSVEAAMLVFLRRFTELPVPEVEFASDHLLLLEYLPGGGAASSDSEVHAAELLAALHSIGPGDITPEEVLLPGARGASSSGLDGYESDDVRPARRADSVEPVGSVAASTEGENVSRAPSPNAFGFFFDTLIGPFSQHNPWTTSWVEFYRRQRLAPMLDVCRERKRLPSRTEARLTQLLERLDELVGHEPRPGLIHGDVWSGNVLDDGTRLVGLLDPATYFADPEIELAFIDLFGTFGPRFWDAYKSFRPVGDEYQKRRRDLYQLYPLLVHVALFGGSYVAGLEERLERLTLT